MNIRNAIILAAGTASRFIPLSAEKPKGLLEVKGEILIERQIRQLNDAGVTDITIVTGYMAEKFLYLKEKFGVDLIFNEDFQRYNNISSIIRVLNRLNDTYICSSDNYFSSNVFLEAPTQSYYSALYAEGPTEEYCIESDNNGNIVAVTVGGRDSWYMIGHVYFSRDFSDAFRSILETEYEKEEMRNGYWEDVFIKNIPLLPPMSLHRYNAHEIEEFDSIDELRTFDKSYIEDTRSIIIKDIARRLECKEARLSKFVKSPCIGDRLSFSFFKDDVPYLYDGIHDEMYRI